MASLHGTGWRQHLTITRWSATELFVNCFEQSTIEQFERTLQLHHAPLPVNRGDVVDSKRVVMARKCVFTGKKPNVGNKVSHSHRKSKKRQAPNLQRKRLWWPEGGRFVRIRLSTRAMRTIDKNGIQNFADQVGLDLSQY